MKFSCWVFDTPVLLCLLKRFVMASCWQPLTNSFRGHAGSQGSFKETHTEEDRAPCCDHGARLQTHPAGLQRIAHARACACPRAFTRAHTQRTSDLHSGERTALKARRFDALARSLTNVHAPGSARTRDTQSNWRVYPSVFISQSSR